MTPHTRLLAVTLGIGLALSCSFDDGLEDYECRRNEDCAADEYCGNLVVSGCGSSGGECLRRLQQGARCEVGPIDSCAAGLVCHQAFGDGNGTGQCQPPSAMGGACAASGDCGTDPVQPVYGAPVCDRASRACVPPFSLAEGVPCDDRRACAPHLVCVGDEENRAACRAPGGVGASCNGLWLDGLERACAEGLTCVQTDGQRRCVDAGGPDQPCFADRSCDDGLFCLPGADEAYACRLPLGPGERCFPGTCAAGLACRLDLANSSSACGTPLREGELCHWGECDSGLVCATDRSVGAAVCTAPRGVGEPCGWSPDCADGLLCGADGTCLDPGPPRGEGEACSPLAPCDEGLLCREHCVRPAGVGGVCNTQRDCEAGLGCIGGVCAP